MTGSYMIPRSLGNFLQGIHNDWPILGPVHFFNGFLYIFPRILCVVQTDKQRGQSISVICAHSENYFITSAKVSEE